MQDALLRAYASCWIIIVYCRDPVRRDAPALVTYIISANIRFLTRQRDIRSQFAMMVECLPDVPDGMRLYVLAGPAGHPEPDMHIYICKLWHSKCANCWLKNVYPRELTNSPISGTNSNDWRVFNTWVHMRMHTHRRVRNTMHSVRYIIGKFGGRALVSSFELLISNASKFRVTDRINPMILNGMKFAQATVNSDKNDWQTCSSIGFHFPRALVRRVPSVVIRENRALFFKLHQYNNSSLRSRLKEIFIVRKAIRIGCAYAPEG